MEAAFQKWKHDPDRPTATMRDAFAAGYAAALDSVRELARAARHRHIRVTGCLEASCNIGGGLCSYCLIKRETALDAALAPFTALEAETDAR